MKETVIEATWVRRVYSNDSIYLGEVVEDDRHGNGLYVFESGDIYYGRWCRNKMSGAGKYIYKNG